jgi:hypothetical protein
MPSQRKNYEKEEGHCDHCQQVFSKNKGKYIERYSIKPLVVCKTCYGRFIRNKKFEKKKRGRKKDPEVQNYICPECKVKIKDTKSKKRKKAGNRMYCLNCASRLKTKREQEQNNYLLSLTPEELIQRVRHL